MWTCFLSSRRRHTRCALVTGVQTCALPISFGTVKLLEWMEANGHVPDLCLVGEPTSEHRLGDVVKIGRRGSVNVWITVPGIQGHVAYPHLADNPITPLVRLLNTLKARVLDEGSDWFAPSNLAETDL